jgi:hypothetical protein
MGDQHSLFGVCKHPASSPEGREAMRAACHLGLARRRHVSQTLRATALRRDRSANLPRAMGSTAARTLFDWLSHARTATDPAEVEAFPWRGHRPGPSLLGPVALVLLFLLRTVTSPDDPRLVDLAQTLIAQHDLAALSGAMAESMRADLWTTLFDRILVPWRESHRPTAQLLAATGR